MLKKIISGGQTGADQGALDAAIKYNFPHGGWIPKGRRTEIGRLPDNYKLKEMRTDSYPHRTEQNIVDSDGTIIISHGKLTGGSKLTKTFANKHNRPCLHIDLNETPAFIATSEINTWVINHGIEVLNVAGSRASKDPEIYQNTMYIIEGVILLSLANAKSGGHITDYDRKELLGKIPIPPKTVDEAVERMLSDLDLESKVKIANMDLNKLSNIHFELHVYFKNAFGVWHGNKELLADCRATSGEPIRDEAEATFVILKAVWEKLRGTHTLRVVK